MSVRRNEEKKTVILATHFEKRGNLLGERNNTRHNFGSLTSWKTKSTMGGQYHKMDWFEGRSLAAAS